MTYDCFTVLTLFGTLLVLTATMVSWPSTILVSAQTAIDRGVDTLNSLANEIATGNNNMTEVKLLFIQGAQSGSISLSEINATTSTLESNVVSDKTRLF